jgi:hypothetical protein
MRLRAAVLVGMVAATAAFLAPARADGFLPTFEARSLLLLNTARGDGSLAALHTDPALHSMARAQAVRMADRGQIYHNPNLASDINASGLRWLRVGENVGVGPDVDAINAAFLASPHHRENMLFPGYSAVGVGIVRGIGDQSNRIYVAHVFAQLSGRVALPASPPQATRRPAPRLPASPPAPTAGPKRATPPQPSPVRSVLDGGVVDRTVLFGGPDTPVAA